LYERCISYSDADAVFMPAALDFRISIVTEFCSVFSSIGDQLRAFMEVDSAAYRDASQLVRIIECAGNR